MIITTKVDVVPGSCARHRDVATDSKALWTRVREASRARAPDSPSPGECRVSRMPANATAGRSGRAVSGAGERSAPDERPGPTKNTGKGRFGTIRS
jgi:hypothetical protein